MNVFRQSETNESKAKHARLKQVPTYREVLAKADLVKQPGQKLNITFGIWMHLHTYICTYTYSRKCSELFSSTSATTARSQFRITFQFHKKGKILTKETQHFNFYFQCGAVRQAGLDVCYLVHLFPPHKNSALRICHCIKAGSMTLWQQFGAITHIQHCGGSELDSMAIAMYA